MLNRRPLPPPTSAMIDDVMIVYMTDVTRHVVVFVLIQLPRSEVGVRLIDGVVLLFLVVVRLVRFG